MASVQGRRSGNWLSAVIWGGAACLLAAPLIAMQFTDEVVWTAFDFLMIGGLLAGVCLALELVVRRSGSIAYRAGAALALATGLVLIWMNGAVGIIGSEDEAPTLLYAAVPLVALAGVALARLRPAGMARAMVATAIVQALVPAAALVGWPHVRAEILAPPPLVLSGAFVGAWLLAAWLFRRAASA